MENNEFAQLFEKSLAGLRTEFTPGEKVSGIVTSIDKRSVFVDICSTSEGIINREELLDNDEQLTVKIGDTVEAFYVDDNDGEITLTVKMKGRFIDQHLEDAYISGIPVEGKVVSERKGGYSVKIAGHEAFCPYSQIDIYRKNDSDAYIGNSYYFIITELSKRNLVISRRRQLEKEREKRLDSLRETLKVGDTLEGTAVKIMDFGVFVDLDGIEGFIPISELAWGKIKDPREFINEGDRIKVNVIKLDWEQNKISLSFKTTQTPWDDIENKYQVGTTHDAVITSLTHFGAFAKLEKGIEGLIHISNFGTGKRISHPKEVVSPGDKVKVSIENLDSKNQRISLKREEDGKNDTSEDTHETVIHSQQTAVKNTEFGNLDSLFDNIKIQ